MSEALPYRIVDVFTDSAYAGNPLAVVLGADHLSPEQLQAIAVEFNLSETAFPMAASSDEASYRLRIFTPGEELPFAGHPSVGSAWVMRSLGRVADGPIVQECGAGLLPLVIDGSSVTLTGGTPYLGDPIDGGPVLAAVGLTESDLVGDAVRLAGVGINFAYLHVVPEALGRLQLNVSALNVLDEVTGVSVFAYRDGAADARVFAADVGEDPATGSAALGLGVWLSSAGYVDADGESSYVVTQGVAMGRPSRLECVVCCEGGVVVETRVTGSVVPIAEGTIRPPD